MSMGWSCQVQGCWSPADEFAEYLPLYFRMSETSRLNEQWVRATLDAQQAQALLSQKNLMRSMAELRESYDNYNQSYWERQRSQDYLSWARSQSTLGQGSWVSELEGARVADTYSWGLDHRDRGALEGNPWNTTNFNGRDPFTGEGLGLVDTRQEYEQFIRGR